MAKQQNGDGVTGPFWGIVTDWLWDKVIDPFNIGAKGVNDAIKTWYTGGKDTSKKFKSTGAKDSVRKALRNSLAAAGVSSEQIDKISNFLADQIPDVPALDWLYAIFIHVLQAVNGLMLTKDTIGAAFDRILRQGVLPTPADPTVLYRHYWKTGNEKLLLKWWPDTGMGLELMKAWQEALKPVIDPPEILELFRRRVHDSGGWGGITKDGKGPYPEVDGYTVPDIQKLMERHGWLPSKMLNTVFSLAQTLLSEPHIMELTRRGDFTIEDFDMRLGQLGYRRGDRQFIHQLTRSLLNPGTAADMFRHGIMDRDKTIKAIAEHGYSKGTAKGILETSYRELQPVFLADAVNRGLITEQQFKTTLHKQGYREEAAEVLNKTRFILPSPSDLVRFGVREVFTPEIAKRFGQFREYPEEITKWGEKIGLKKEVMQLFWAAHWDLPSPQQGFDLYHRGIISPADLGKLLRALDIMPYWRQKMVALSHRLVPRRAIPRMVKDRLLKEEETYQSFIRLGFHPVDARKLTISAFKRLHDGDIALTKNELIDAYRRDVIDRQELEDGLIELDLTETAREYFLVKADTYKAKDILAAEGRAEKGDAATARDLTKTDVLRGLSVGMLTEDEARDYLTELDYSPTAVDYLIKHEVLKKVLTTLDEKAKRLQKLFESGAIDVAEAIKQLVGYGYVPTEAQTITTDWQEERKIEETFRNLTGRLPTRADLKDWLVKGILEPAQWATYMAQHGYADQTIRHYLEEIIIDVSE